MTGWLEVWLQGGEADDWRYLTMTEPADPLVMLRLPGDTGWMPVPAEDGWPGAVTYRRAASVEQFERERIYYPEGLVA